MENKLSDEKVYTKFKELNTAVTQIISSLCDDSDQNEKSKSYKINVIILSLRRRTDRRDDEYI